MKQIYSFEKESPPIINENIIRLRLEKKRKRKYLIALVFASILVQLSVLVFGFSLAERYPYFEFLSIFYIVMSLTCGGVVAVVFGRKGGLQ